MADKLVLLSDVHLTWDNPTSRLDELHKTQFKKLEFVYKWAKRNNAIVVQGGDLVNKPRSWYLLPLTIKFFGTWKEKGVETYMVRGQHDYYYYSEASGPATVVGALLEAGLINLIGNDGPTTLNVGGKKVRLYGASFGESVPNPGKFSDSNLLIVHREISDTALFEGHKFFSHKGFLKRHKNYKLILAADIHRKFKACLLSTAKKVPRYIVNTGPMLRSSATTYNFEHKPGFYVWDPILHNLNWKLIPCEPADEVLSRGHIKKQEEDDKKMAELTAKLKKRVSDEYGIVPNEDIPTFQSGCEEYLEEHHISKEVSEAIMTALEEIDINEL